VSASRLNLRGRSAAATACAFVHVLSATLCGTVLLLAPPAARGQQQRAPTDADIARAAKSQPVVTDRDIEQAAKQHRMPSDAELARVPVPATPHIDALPQPQVQRRIDLGAVARGYEAMGSPSPSNAGVNKGPSLLVFVSFSMPEPTLDRLVDQAARSGATILLRGFFDGSLQQTVTRAQRLIGQRQVGFQIDPQAFDRFSVGVTPTFVLLKDGAVPEPCAAGTCYPYSAFVSASGDVSIDYALEHFKRASPSFSREAATFLSKLKGS
jgi:conjugal transfer pilus assembly protein TrbC